MEVQGVAPRNILRRLLKLAFWLLLWIVAIPLAFLVSCQSKLIYFPRPYPPGTSDEWQRKTGGKCLDFQTSQGKQRAFLQGNLKSPRNLWILCGGNGTVALDWSEWLEEHAPKDDAWLLVDFPGYGNCQGSATPNRIHDNLKAAVPLAFQAIGWPNYPNPKRLRIFGHSLGSAACLAAASEFEIQRGVLLTPFTSTMDMSRHMIGLPIGFLVWHRFDNSARLAELTTRGPGKIIIFHGTDDEAIPVTMSRTLANEQPQTVRLIEIPGGRHNTLQETHTDQIQKALEEIGREAL
jgi:uncharacterized protein